MIRINKIVHYFLISVCLYGRSEKDIVNDFIQTAGLILMIHILFDVDRRNLELISF